jgi:hypothetical protein
MLQTWVQTLISAQVAGAALSNSTSATSLLPSYAKVTLPNNFFTYAGQMLRITAAYQVSNVVTTPGTLTLDVRFGAVVVFTSGAMTMSTTAHTTLPLWVQILLTCRAVGSSTSANLMGQGVATSQVLSLTSVADSTTTPATLLMPNTTPAVGTGFDSTTTEQIDHFGTFSVATSPTNITLQQWVVESLN